jgi:hypothetical protein
MGKPFGKHLVHAIGGLTQKLAHVQDQLDLPPRTGQVFDHATIAAMQVGRRLLTQRAERTRRNRGDMEHECYRSRKEMLFAVSNLFKKFRQRFLPTFAYLDTNECRQQMILFRRDTPEGNRCPWAPGKIGLEILHRLDGNQDDVPCSYARETPLSHILIDGLMRKPKHLSRFFKVNLSTIGITTIM